MALDFSWGLRINPCSQIKTFSSPIEPSVFSLTILIDRIEPTNWGKFWSHLSLHWSAWPERHSGDTKNQNQQMSYQSSKFRRSGVPIRSSKPKRITNLWSLSRSDILIYQIHVWTNAETDPSSNKRNTMIHWLVTHFFFFSHSPTPED